MTTARILVTDALDLLAVHAAEEPLTAHQCEQGLRVLGDLLQSLSLEQFFIYYMMPMAVSWPSGKRVLTWGPGGDIPQPRPVQLGIEAQRYDAVIDYSYPLAVWPLQEFMTISQPSMQSDPLQVISYAPNFPLGELYGWPAPRTTTQVTVYPWMVLRSWGTFDEEIGLPPGYDRLLKLALAADLAPYYDKEVPTTVALLLQEARRNVKTINVTIPKLAVPPFADPYGQWGMTESVWARG